EDLFLIGLHVGGDAIEQGGAQEETPFVPLQAEAATIEDELRSFVNGHLDVALDARLVLPSHERTKLRFRVSGDADTQAGDFLQQALAHRICCPLSHRNYDR